MGGPPFQRAPTARRLQREAELLAEALLTTLQRPLQREAELLAEALRTQLGEKCAECYHGGLSMAMRAAVQRRFMAPGVSFTSSARAARGEVRVAVAKALLTAL